MTRTPSTYDALRLFASGERIPRGTNARAEAGVALKEIANLRAVVRKLRRDEQGSEDILSKLQAELDQARAQIAAMASERPS